MPRRDPTVIPPALSRFARLMINSGDVWDIVRVMTGHEKALAWEMTEARVNYYLPMTRERDAQRRLRHYAMCPGYLFVSSPEPHHTRYLLLRRHGHHVFGFVEAEQAQLVRDLVRIREASAADPTFGTRQNRKRAEELYRTGVRCEVVGGSFDGNEAVIERGAESGYAVINIKSLGPLFGIVEVPVEQLRILTPDHDRGSAASTLRPIASVGRN